MNDKENEDILDFIETLNDEQDPEEVFPVSMISLARSQEIFLSYSDKNKNILTCGDVIKRAMTDLSKIGETESEEAQNEALAKVMLIANGIITGVIGRTFGFKFLQSFNEDPLLYNILSEVCMHAMLVAGYITNGEIMPVFEEQTLSQEVVDKLEEEQSKLKTLLKELQDTQDD